MRIVYDIIAAMMFERVIAQAPDNLQAMVEFDPEPAPAALFADGVGCATTPERIADQIPGGVENSITRSRIFVEGGSPAAPCS